jgi:hypothetical protein
MCCASRTRTRRKSPPNRFCRSLVVARCAARQDPALCKSPLGVHHTFMVNCSSSVSQSQSRSQRSHAICRPSAQTSRSRCAVPECHATPIFLSPSDDERVAESSVSRIAARCVDYRLPCADGGGVFSSHCGCYFQKSLNLSSGDISVYRGADSRPQRLDRLYHVTPNNAPPMTTATSESSMVARLRSSSMITALRMGSETHLSWLMVFIRLRRTHRSDPLGSR